MDRAIPINEDGAEAVVSSVVDASLRNLLLLFLANARMQFMRRSDQSEEEWLAQLPTTPFDMEFFARVLSKSLARPDIIRRIMDGASIAEASGWDV